jgi:hypothetical protein
MGFALGELALILAAVFQFEVAEAGKLVILESAAIAHATLFEGAFTFAAPLLEAADVLAVVGGQAALPVPQATLEFAAVHVAIAGMPFPLALIHAIAEFARVPSAVRVVDAALALQ